MLPELIDKKNTKNNDSKKNKKIFPKSNKIKTNNNTNKNILEDKKISSEYFPEKQKSNILELISVKTDKSTASRQSINSKKSKENQIGNKKNNSDQSIDSKISDNTDTQILLQNYLNEVTNSLNSFCFRIMLRLKEIKPK